MSVTLFNLLVVGNQTGAENGQFSEAIAEKDAAAPNPTSGKQRLAGRAASHAALFHMSHPTPMDFPSWVHSAVLGENLEPISATESFWRLFSGIFGASPRAARSLVTCFGEASVFLENIIYFIIFSFVGGEN